MRRHAREATSSSSFTSSKLSATQCGQRESLVSDIIIIIIFWILFFCTEEMEPFNRILQPEEIWKYKYPVTPPYVHNSILWCLAILGPASILTIDFLLTRNKTLYQNAIVGLFLMLGLTGFLVNFIKVIVGRPRPDFYARCSPGGKKGKALDCTGDEHMVKEGRKSFPSGHASFAFASMVYSGLYLRSRVSAVSQKYGDSWGFMCVLIPLIIATGISVSRTCDYHHHWEDVVVGGLIGIIIGVTCYRQYNPNTIRSLNSHIGWNLNNY